MPAGKIILIVIAASFFSALGSGILVQFSQDPPPRIAVLGLAGLMEEFKQELREIPDDEFLIRSAQFGKAVNEGVQELNEQGWIILTDGAVLAGAQDVTPELRANLCLKLQLLCSKGDQ